MNRQDGHKRQSASEQPRLTHKFPSEWIVSIAASGSKAESWFFFWPDQLVIFHLWVSTPFRVTSQNTLQIRHLQYDS